MFCKGLTSLYPIISRAQTAFLPGALRAVNGNYSVAARSINTSSVRCGLNEFFDEDQYDSDKAIVGRPWRKEELRIKSNRDLHKLWYVLLKERNMVMTMKHMYDEAMEPLPNPERLDKVEESMENILDVVKERNRAYQLLEYGTTDEPKPYIARNAIGIPYERTPEEHYVPKHLNKHYKLMHSTYKTWMSRYLALYEEKQRRQRNYRRRMHEKKRQEFMEEFKMAEDEIPEKLDTKEDPLDKYLELTDQLNDVGRQGR